MDLGTIPGGNGGYELHQKLRTKTVRLMRKNKHNEAVETLHSGAIQLLDMNEEGSACDLAEYLLEVYMQAHVPMDNTSRERINSILEKTKSPMWRRKTVMAANKWAISATQNPLGDEKLRLFLAELLARGMYFFLLSQITDKQFYEAETHFIAACALNKDNASKFAHMLLEWNSSYAETLTESDSDQPPKDSVERVLSGTFALRGWVPYVGYSKLFDSHTQTATCSCSRECKCVHPGLCAKRNQAPPGFASSSQA